jgi:PAS domain S-box-containing protein
MKMKKITPLTWKNSVLSMGIIVIASLLRLWPLQSLGTSLTWLTFYPAVMIISVYGGLWTGIMATAAACIIANNFWYLIALQPFIRNQADWIGMGVFIFTGALISSISEAMRQANTRAVEAERQTHILNLAIANQKAEESEAKYKFIFDNTIQGIVYHNSQGAINDANKAAERILGLSPDQMQGRSSIDPHWKAIHEDGTDFPGNSHPAAITLQTGKDISNVKMGVFNPVKQDYTWINVNSIPRFRKGYSSPYEVIATFEDITHIKKATEELLESKTKLEAALFSMSDAVSISDADGNFNHFNEAFATFHKFKSKEDCAKTFAEYPKLLDVYLPDGQPVPIEQWAVPRALRGEISTNSEYALRRKDTGETWTGSYSFAPIRDKNGLIVGSVVVCRDITNQIQTEEAIRTLNAELEKRVVQRTEQLEATNKELESFSYSVSHDLRAPLRHINAFTEILTREYFEQLPENARKYLHTIKDSAHKMGILIDDLLSFSKTGRGELKYSFISMNQVVQDVLAQISPCFTERKVDWNIEDLPETYGDCNLLNRVWLNLMDNAVKYTGTRETAVIKIGFQDEMDEIVYYIRDNGVGFDMKYANKLFGVFQRLHSSVEFDGNGIGLANVQRIISRHGGRTWAESETDKGATFYFSIPKYREDS